MKKHLIIATALLGSSSIFGAESATAARQNVEQVADNRIASYANYSKETRQAWLETRDTVPVAIRLAEAKILITSFLRSNNAPKHVLDALIEDLTGLYHLGITDNSKLNDAEVREFSRLTEVARIAQAGLPLTEDQKAQVNSLLQSQLSNRKLTLRETTIGVYVASFAIWMATHNLSEYDLMYHEIGHGLYVALASAILWQFIYYKFQDTLLRQY